MKSVMLAKSGGMATALSLGAGYFLSQHRPRQPTVVSGGQTLLSPSDSAGEPEEGSKIYGFGFKDGVGIVRFEEASPSFITSSTMSSSVLRYPLFPSGERELDCSSSESDKDSEKSESSMKQEIHDLKNLLKSLQDKEAEFENEVRTIDKESRKEITELKEKERKLEVQILEYGNHREQEIVELKNSIDALVDREARLERQVLSYNNLREEMTAVKDLETRVKIADYESQLFTSKMEAMRSENRRLEVELSVHSRVRAQLVAAGEKIKRLKKKMKSNSKKAKQKVSTLRKRISTLQQKEGEILNHIRSVEAGNLHVLKVLEKEAEDLRIENLRLIQENSDLAKKMETESNRAPVSSISEQINEAMEETRRLRQANDELTKQIEQVRADQSSEIEKVVYLRWINACLRHELRNYRPGAGKIAAADLNYSPSPKSAGVARDLILHYSDDESPIEIDLKYCSSSHSPQRPEIEIDENHQADDEVDDHSTTRKPRLLGQLKKLMLGRDSHKQHDNPNSPTDDVLPRRISFESTYSSIDMNRESSRTIHSSRSLSSSSRKWKRIPERPQLRTSNSVGLFHRPTSFSLC